MIEKQDYLWRNISQLPYFRGLLRAVECKYYQQFRLVEPILDLGSGDGHFASVAFDYPLNCGTDPWMQSIRESKSINAHRLLIRSEGASLPFCHEYYETVICNSVLEHIPDLDPVLFDVNRILKENGKFIFCVPNQRFVDSLSIFKFLKGIGIKRLAIYYQRFFNKISRHHHCDDPDKWTKRLTNAGFKVEKYFHYFSKKAFWTLEWGHFFGLPSLIWKKIFGKWILVPRRWNLIIVEWMTRKFYSEGEMPNEGVYTFYVATKSGNISS